MIEDENLLIKHDFYVNMLFPGKHLCYLEVFFNEGTTTMKNQIEPGHQITVSQNLISRL